MAGHSFGVLWAAHKKIHWSVAVICVQDSGWHSFWSFTAIPFNSMQNCLFINQMFTFPSVHSSPWLFCIHPTDYILSTSLFLWRLYLRCSYFQTPSSCESGALRISSIAVKSFLMSCWMYCCTAKVLSISSNNSSGQR